jgi:hypothetical protein
MASRDPVPTSARAEVLMGRPLGITTVTMIGVMSAAKLEARPGHRRCRVGGAFDLGVP